MKLKLFQIVVEGRDPVFVAARTSHRASFTFIVRELDDGRPCPTFTAERVDHNMSADKQLGLEDMLTYGSQGIAEFDPQSGWRSGPSA